MATSKNLKGLATVTFFADDIAAAKKWYSQLLGIEAYYAFPNAEAPAYIEFRIGDYEHELGFIDRKYAPQSLAQGIGGGGVAYWHVEDVQATFAQLIGMGAKELEPVTPRGENGDFITASVIDPFGNVLGIMYNPHYKSILNGNA
ncbi:VOC family protein [Pseudoflavitalea sp. G-6-1-2]|uniref:VOC family protein n=1 Tax=Pseudoflavitalea sp. G-6-1-2 TaxID=2728841 RepID=UPI001469FAC3|nr:VOC family protein [Pseudoflavitalea sp. G-6-1-2]NML23580.1 VOC family protein [Pseudoflavitalea sp. G-6-1-2]